jgi:acyl carrier protein
MKIACVWNGQTIKAKAEPSVKPYANGKQSLNGGVTGRRNQCFTVARLFCASILAEFSMSTAERITAIATKMLVKRGNMTIPGTQDNLREAGLTSLDMVNLMLAIEAEFDIEIPQSAMTPENFDTICAVESLVSVTAKAA